MRRNFVLLNLLLVVLAAATFAVLRDRWRQAEGRRAEVLERPVASPKTVGADTKSAALPPRAASYFDVAEKMLFSKDRNPTVIVEVEAPKPMPPLPAAYGVMNLGGAAVAFLAEKGESQRGYNVGEKIGPFTLKAANEKEITFDWDGQEVKRRVEELRGESREATAAAAVNQRPVSPAVTNLSPASAPAQPNSAAQQNQAPRTGSSVFGPDSGDKKYCIPGDTTAPGTVVEGWKKVIAQTPISKVCYWEQVK